MNPWEIVSLIGAACTGVLITAFTISIVRALIKGPTKPDRLRSTHIL